MTRQKEQEDQAEKTREEIGKGNQMTALRFQTVMLFVLITIMLGFSFIQYTNTWLSHKAFFITRDIDI